MVKPAALDWNDLRYFLRAVREKTLSGAGRKLGANHSLIGRRIAALGSSLGASLFVRLPDGLILTPLGESALSRAEEVERSALGLETLVSSQTTHVRLAVPSGFGNLFGAALPRLR
jgi:DNA-binding transcriptional LysR family regulator